MDHPARALTRPAAPILVAALALAGGCDRDPLVVLGDRPGLIRIVAGVPDQPGDSLGPSGLETELRDPSGLAVGDDGTLYIADGGNSRVLALSSSGSVKAVVDHSRRFQGPRLLTPDGLALDGPTLVIADPASRRVWRVDLAGGEPSPIAGSGTAGTAGDTVDALSVDLLEPRGVAVDSDGRIYISERLGNRIRRLELDGTVITFAGTGIPGFAGDSGPAREAALNRPVGLALARDTLFIADSGNQRVRAIDLASSTITTTAGTGEPGLAGDGGLATDALLDTPAAVGVTPEGELLYIADTGNNRIRLVNRSMGRITTFAGTGDDAFAGDLLSAGATSLDEPRGVAATALDILFMADTGHHIVLRTTVGFRTAP